MANKVEIEIDGKNQGAVKAINGVNKELLNMDKIASGVTSSLGPLGRSISSMLNPSMLLGAGLATAFAGATALISKSIVLADELDKVSQKTGISVESLSQLKFAADQSNTSMDSLQTGLKKMSTAVFDAQNGNKEMISTFKLLNVSLTDNEGKLKTNEQLLFNVADRFSKVKDGAAKTALAVKLFGRSGTELIPLLNEGEDGLRRMMETANELGLTISTQTAKDADVLLDQIDKLKASFEGLAIQTLPSVINSINALSDIISSTGTFIKDIKNVRDEIDAIFGVDIYDKYRKMAEDYERIKNEQRQSAAEFTKGFYPMNTVPSAGVNQDDLVVPIQNANTEAQKLAAQWDSIGKKLKLEINAFGLDPQEEKILRLVTQAEDYKKQFADIPESLSVIQDWLATQLFTLYNLTKAKPAEQPGVPLGTFGMSGVDITLLQSLHDQQIALTADVTDQELAMYLLREGAFTDMLGNMAGAMQTFATLSGNSNKTLFGIYKAFGIAEAGVATYLAATKALAEVPYPFNFVAAAAVTAAGLANIARIASMQPGGGVSGANPSPPSSGSVNSIRNETTNNSKSVVVNVYGFVGMDKDAIARELAPAIEKAWKDGVGNG